MREDRESLVRNWGPKMTTAGMDPLTADEQHKLDLESQKLPGIHVLYPRKGATGITTSVEYVTYQSL
jgi:hypothetical protein